MTERYFLRIGLEEPKEVTKEQFARAERDCGFFPKISGDLSTNGFYANGTTEFGEYLVQGEIARSDNEVPEIINLLSWEV